MRQSAIIADCTEKHLKNKHKPLILKDKNGQKGWHALCIIYFIKKVARGQPSPLRSMPMNSTLLLLNALALAALVGLVLQPDGVAVPVQAHTAPAMKAQLAVFGTPAAPVQSAPRVSSERLVF